MPEKGGVRRMNTRPGAKKGKSVAHEAKWRKSQDHFECFTNLIATELEDELNQVEDRWKNGIKDIESKTGANIETSHYPLVAKIKINFRAISTENIEKRFQQFSKANKDEWANFNSALTTKRIQLNNSKEDNDLIMEIAEKTLNSGFLSNT